jgi:hypothetical protein
MTAHWSWISQTFGGYMSFDYFPRLAGNRLSTAAQLADFDKFFARQKSHPALARAIAVGHNDIAARLAWLERDRAAVIDKLMAYQSR